MGYGSRGMVQICVDIKSRAPSFIDCSCGELVVFLCRRPTRNSLTIFEGAFVNMNAVSIRFLRQIATELLQSLVTVAFSLALQVIRKWFLGRQGMKSERHQRRG